MTVRYGFFNSIDGDRKYDANDFSHLFEGIITDGIFPTVGKGMAIFWSDPASMVVKVGSGRAYFRGHWIWNDDDLPLTVEDSHPTLKRIDTIVIDVDERDEYRSCSIHIVKGTPATTPVPPSLYDDADKLQVRVADITVDAGVTAIQPSKIQSYIGTIYCPLVFGAVKGITVESVYAQWDASFHEWFESLQTALEGDVAATLTSQMAVANADIDALQSAVASIPAPTKITSGTSAPSGGTSGDIYLRYV